MDEANTLLFAKGMLGPSLRAAVTQGTINELLIHLTGLVTNNVSGRQAAALSLINERLNLHQDLHQAERRITKLFRTAGIVGEAEKVNYLERMLSGELHSIMWSRQSATSKAFFDDLQAIKNNRLGPEQDSAPEYYPVINTPSLSLPSQAVDFGLSNRTTTQVATSTAPVQSVMEQLTAQMKEMQAHMIELARNQRQPRNYQPPQRRINTGDVECWGCGERGHTSRQCYYNNQGQGYGNRACTPPSRQAPERKTHFQEERPQQNQRQSNQQRPIYQLDF